MGRPRKYSDAERKERKRQSDMERRSTPEYKKQNAACYLCGTVPKPIEGKRYSLEVDHNHTTGEVRKLLCRACNIAIGHLESKPSEWLNRAFDYIKRGY